MCCSNWCAITTSDLLKFENCMAVQRDVLACRDSGLNAVGDEFDFPVIYSKLNMFSKASGKPLSTCMVSFQFLLFSVGRKSNSSKYFEICFADVIVHGRVLHGVYNYILVSCRQKLPCPKRSKTRKKKQTTTTKTKKKKTNKPTATTTTTTNNNNNKQTNKEK